MDWSSLAALQQLDYLAVHGAGPPKSVEAIGQLAGLRELNLSSCTDLDDITPLGQLPKLEYLDLTYCWAISDFSPLSRLTKLRGLSLSDTGVSDLSFMDDLVQLRYVNLADCPSLDDVTPLKAFLRRGGYVDCYPDSALYVKLQALRQELARE